MSAFNRRLSLPRVAGLPLPVAIGWLVAGTTLLLAVITRLPVLFCATAASALFALACLRLGEDLRLWRVMICAISEKRRVLAEGRI